MAVKHRSSCQYSQRGYILIFTIIAMTVALVIVMPVLSFLSTTYLTTVKTLERTETYLTREAGVEYGITKLKNDRNLLTSLNATPLTSVPLPLPPTQTNNQDVISLKATLLTPSQWDLVIAPQGDRQQIAKAPETGDDNLGEKLAKLLAAGLSLIPSETVQAAIIKVAPFLKTAASAPANPGTVDLVKTTQPDFEAAGSTRTNLDTSTTPGDMFLRLGGTPGTTFSSGPALKASVGNGAHAIKRPDGKFLIVRGNSTTGTNLYDPVANSFVAGPALGGNAGAGAHAIQRPDGRFLIVRGNSTTGTNIYNPVANTIATGPALISSAGAGAHAIQRPDGKFLIVRGNNTITTFIYDPVTNSFTTGPALGGSARAGAHAIQRPDGKFLIVRGNNTITTFIYDPVANSFTTGPALGGNAGAGAHSIQRPDGSFLVVRGNNTTGTNIYNPVTNTMAAGPALTATARYGSHSIQRADGTFLIIRGNNTTGTVVYNPTANTMATGPSLSSAASSGAHSLQRTDGKFLIVRGNSSKTTFIYDAGWYVTGQYISEKLNPGGILQWNTISWTKTADDTIAFSVRTATTNAGLDTATYRSVSNGGSIGAGVGEVWLQIKADYSRAIPSYPGADTSIWGGESHTFYQRSFAIPNVQSITMNYTVNPNPPTSLSQFKSDGATAIPTGAYTDETTVVLKLGMSSPAEADTLTPQVEVRPLGTSFTNTPTQTGAAVPYSGSAVTGSATVTGLTMGTDYHWQARVAGISGNSAWVSYGGNPEAERDFGIFTTVSIGKTVAPGTVSAGDTVSYTITVSNTGAGVAKVTAITDTLPAGFSYVFGSTTGATTSNPSIAGQTLTWSLSQNVAIGTPLALSFQATTPLEGGTYNNNASVQGTNFATASTGNTAPVVVNVPIVSMSKTVSSGSVSAGDTVSYTLTVSNSGAGVARVTAIADTLSAGFSYIANSTTGATTSNPTISGQTLTWSLSQNVTTATPLTLSFQATTPLGGGTYNNNASVQGSNFATVNTGDTAPVLVNIPVVSIAKTISPGTVSPGDTVSYTLTVSNSGAGVARVTAIADTLPAGFSYISGSTTGATTDNPAIAGQTLTWSLSQNVAGTPLTLTFQATTSTTEGTYNNNVSALGSNFTTVSTGDTAPVVVARPNVAITKTVNPTSAFGGDTATYTITIANTSGGPAQVTAIGDTLPAGFSYVNGSTIGTTTDNPSIAGQVLTWSLSRTINAGSNITLSFQATISATAGTYYDNASVQGNNFTTVSTGDTAPVVVTAVAISIAKSVSPGTATAGDTVSYIITVTNPSGGVARVTAITDTLPAGFSYVSGSTSGATTSNPTVAGQTLTWSLSQNVTTGAPLTLSFQATTTITGGTYYDNASVQGSNFATVSTGNTAPVVVNVPIVSIVKATSPGTVSPGDAVSYTITVSNSGAGVAKVTAITDTLPTGFSYVFGSTSGATTSDPSIAGQTLTWSLSQNVTGMPLALTFQATTSTTEDTYNNNTSVLGSNFTTVSTGDTAPVIVARPNVTIAKAVNPASVVAGQSVTYTITIANTSGGPARVTSISDTLPVGFSYINGSTTGTTTDNPSIAGQTLTWSLTRTIAVGSDITLSFGAMTPGTSGTFYNDAAASGDNFTTLSTGNTAPVIITPAPAGPGTIDLIKTSQADFEAAGSTRTNLDTATIPGDMFLSSGATPGTTFSIGPNLTNDAGDGAHSLQRPDGKFLIVLGDNTRHTTIYDPVANTMTAGTDLTDRAGDGAHSVKRPDGKFLIVLGDNSRHTTIYDPVANTVASGPDLTERAGDGSHSIKRPDGKFLIVLGDNSKDTTIYDPVANTMTAGPDLLSRADDGAHAIQRPDGKFLIIVGNDIPKTNIYDPVANTLAIGPSITRDVDRGAHSIQRPDGKFLIIHGDNQKSTTLYDPVANTMTAGPTLPDEARSGAHSFQRADGTFLIILGDDSSHTAVYNPVANTMSSGPSLPSGAKGGSHSLQRPDGKFLIIRGSDKPTTFIYDAGWSVTGQYISEKLSPTDIEEWNTISWTKTPDDTVTFSIRTATTDTGLDTATYRSVSNGGSIGAGVGEVWLQVKTEFARAIPSYPGADTNIWAGESHTFYQRTFARPDVQDITLNYSVRPVVPSALAQFKSDGVTVIPTGGYTDETTVVLNFSMSSRAGADTLTPQVEVRPLGTSFTNTPTHTGAAVAYSGSAIAGSVTVSGLTPGTDYHWQARIGGLRGNSLWVSYGGNPESDRDFGLFTTVSIGKTVTPDTVDAGGTVTYSITVSNTGVGVAKVTAITDTLPSDFSYVAGSTTGATTADPSISGQTLTWSLSQNVNPAIPLTLSFQATAPATDGTYYNNASVQGSNFTTASTGNTAPVVVTGVPPNVTIAKIVDSSSAFSGDDVTYTITIANTSGGTAWVTSISDTLATGFIYVTGSTTGTTTANPSISGQTLTWSLTRTIVAGFNIVLSFKATAPSASGTFFDNASVSGANFTPVSTGNTAPVTVFLKRPRIVISEVTGDKSGPPGWATVNVTGYLFTPQKSVVLFWNDLNNPLNPTTDLPTGTALTPVFTTLPANSLPLAFAPVSITIPTNANWGNGYVVAMMETSSGTWVEQDRKPFNVRAKYEIASQTADGVTLTARLAFTGGRSPDGTYSTPTNIPLITIYQWKE